MATKGHSRNRFSCTLSTSQPRRSAQKGVECATDLVDMSDSTSILLAGFTNIAFAALVVYLAAHSRSKQQRHIEHTLRPPPAATEHHHYHRSVADARRPVIVQDTYSGPLGLGGGASANFIVFAECNKIPYQTPNTDANAIRREGRSRSNGAEMLPHRMYCNEHSSAHNAMQGAVHSRILSTSYH